MRELTFVEALNEVMSQEMEANEDIYIMGLDIGIFGGAFGVTNGMVQKFGAERVIDTPISEAVVSGVTVGSALTGMRPIFELQFSDFITVCIDQIVNQAAKLRYMYGGKGSVPLVVRAPSGGGIGFAAQHSQSLEAWTAHIPGLKVVQPSTPYDAKGLFKTALEDDNPVIFYEHKFLYGFKGEVPEESYSIPFGKADIKRKGKDVTIIATSVMVHKSLEAAKVLEKEGIDVEVVDPRTLVPLDEEAIVNSVKKTRRAIVVYEAVQRGGFGTEIVSVINESEAFDFLDAPVIRVGGKPVPMPYNAKLEKAVIPQVEDIIKAVKSQIVTVI